MQTFGALRRRKAQLRRGRATRWYSRGEQARQRGDDDVAMRDGMADRQIVGMQLGRLVAEKPPAGLETRCDQDGWQWAMA